VEMSLVGYEFEMWKSILQTKLRLTQAELW